MKFWDRLNSFHRGKNHRNYMLLKFTMLTFEDSGLSLPKWSPMTSCNTLWLHFSIFRKHLSDWSLAKESGQTGMLAAPIFSLHQKWRSLPLKRKWPQAKYTSVQFKPQVIKEVPWKQRLALSGKVRFNMCNIQITKCATGTNRFLVSRSKYMSIWHTAFKMFAFKIDSTQTTNEGINNSKIKLKRCLTLAFSFP